MHEELTSNCYACTEEEVSWTALNSPWSTRKELPNRS